MSDSGDDFDDGGEGGSAKTREKNGPNWKFNFRNWLNP
jgi:hypothetical protein